MLRRFDLAFALAFVCLAGCVKKQPPECHQASEAMSGIPNTGRLEIHGALLKKDPAAWRSLAEGHKTAALKLMEVKSSNPAIAGAISKLVVAHQQLGDLAAKAEGQKTLDEMAALRRSASQPAERELSEACRAAAD